MPMPPMPICCGGGALNIDRMESAEAWGLAG
eukprot:CAMPEP_0173257854 /NCGR_PEP_ID=MMETSP1142-20121109/24023_1 /TAXON_ID=483371 /ORGANISM="non described non described, Strain CCMP2298" /LENGTH=30 /DNA_ID= /DNA_START= /DNA_END= /DNA_ORIENTATION=